MRPLRPVAPRARLYGSIALVWAVLASGSWGALAGSAATVAWVWAWHGVPARQLGALVRNLRWFLVATVLLEAWEPGGPTWESVGDGVFLAVRLFTAVAAASWTTYGISSGAMADAVRQAMQPLARVGMPVRGLGVALLVAMRFFPLLQAEARRIRLAQSARGFGAVKHGWRHHLESVTTLVIPLFAAAFRRAEVLGEALVARGYDPSRATDERRTAALGRVDWAFITMCCVVAGGQLYW